MKISEKRLTATNDDQRVESLFQAVLQYRSDAERDAVVTSQGRDGAYIGSGDGAVTGRLLEGRLRWSLWSGSCTYPSVRQGQAIPAGLHLCTLNPAGFIDTDDGARIRFDGRGYGLRGAKKYRTGLSLVFATQDARYAWLNQVLGQMDGEFDEQAGRAIWNVRIPADAVPTTQLPADRVGAAASP